MIRCRGKYHANASSRPNTPPEAPITGSPVLVAAGALAAGGHLRFDVAVWIALATCVLGDTLWYEIGRKKGDRVLSMLCRISLERDSCVRRSKVFFEKGANRTLIFSKWLPGVSHVVPAVAGLSGIERQHFFVTNTAGSALWIIVLMLGGYLPVLTGCFGMRAGRRLRMSTGSLRADLGVRRLTCAGVWFLFGGSLRRHVDHERTS